MSSDELDPVVMQRVTEARANEVALVVELAVQRLARLVERLDLSLWNGVVVANDGDTIAVRVPKAGLMMNQGLNAVDGAMATAAARKGVAEMTDAEARAGEHYWGGCPECGGNDGFVNVERTHWFVCDAHKTKWNVGSNLFSCWRRQDEGIWKQNFMMLTEYREVEALSTWVDPAPGEIGPLMSIPAHKSYIESVSAEVEPCNLSHEALPCAQSEN